MSFMWEVVLGAFATLFGILITYVTFVRSRDGYIKQEAAEKSSMLSSLSYISKTIEQVDYNQKETANKISAMNRDIARIDESLRNAHDKISHWSK